jgi:hypothetical protein
MPITVAARSNAWTVFSRSNAVGSNQTRGMYVCVRLFCVCAVGNGLARGLTPRQMSPNDCVWDYETEKKETRTQQRPVEPLVNELSFICPI